MEVVVPSGAEANKCGAKAFALSSGSRKYPMAWTEYKESHEY